MTAAILRAVLPGFFNDRWRIGAALFALSYGAAQLTMLLHNLEINPQYDNQVIFYAFELIEALYKGTLPDFLLTVRKYPMLYTLPFAIPDGIYMFLSGGTMPLVTARFLGRLITLLFSCGTIYVYCRIARMLFGNVKSVLLLLTGILFFLFATAIRPHVPVTFWTLLALYYSLRLREKQQSVPLIFAAFGAAFAAFGTLQNGIFAFLFPCWALLAGNWRPRRVGYVGLIAGVFLGAAIVVGYPFTLNAMLGKTTAFGADLGHDVGVLFYPEHIVTVMERMLTGAPFLVLFALWGLLRLWERKDPYLPVFRPILLYLVLYYAVFSLQPVADGRFFIITLPFLALLGARAFEHAPRPLSTAVLLIGTAVFLKFTYLALIPDTFQQASRSLESSLGLVTTLSAPSYFYDLPPSKFAKNADQVSFVVVPDHAKDMLPTHWTLCHHIVASPTSDDNMFLWVDVPYAFFRIFEIRALGPNISIYCRPDARIGL